MIFIVILLLSQFGILGQVLYLIVSIPDPCCLFLSNDPLISEKMCLRSNKNYLAERSKLNHDFFAQIAEIQLFLVILQLYIIYIAILNRLGKMYKKQGFFDSRTSLKEKNLLQDGAIFFKSSSL